MANDKSIKKEEIAKTLNQVIEATNKKNPKAEDVESLRQMMNEDASIWKTYGDWAKQTELVILSDYFDSSALLKETVTKKLSNMRDELGWQESSEIEKLLIRQICLTWLRLYLVERGHHSNTHESHALKVGVYWDKHLSNAQKRHLRAIESLVKVRKMNAQTTKLEEVAKRARSSQTLNSLKILEAMTKSDD